MREIMILLLNSLFCTYLGEKIPLKLLSPDKWPFKERSWEKGGAVYQKLFRVKSWKTSLPEVSDFIKCIFKKRHIWTYSKDYLSRFVLESCKAELTHWMIIWSSLFINIWDSASAGRILFWLSVALNFPYIIIQRYNRPRIIRYLLNKTKEGLSKQVGGCFVGESV